MTRTSLFGCLLLAALLVLGGCSSRFAELPAGTIRQIKISPVMERRLVEVPPPVLSAEEKKAEEYRVGPGDLLYIHIPGLVERVPSSGSEGAAGGFRVYSSGKILLPLVGGVQVGGLTLEEVQARLLNVYRPYIKNPVVMVEVVEFKSQPLYLLGAFNNAGVQYLDRPVTLLQGIALAGGLEESANLRGARVVREDKVLPVDLFKLLDKSDLRHNIYIRPGDTVYVPDNGQQNVYVFGAVNGGQIPMVNGRLSLLQALTIAGIGESGYDHEHIRIIRSKSPTEGELFVVDLAVIMNGDAMPFPLQGGDIVYVPNRGVDNWNAALADMLPSLQAIGAVLNPFVQVYALLELIEDDNN